MNNKSWFSITAKANDEAAEVSIYDEIGIWGITAKDFLTQLKNIGNRRITLRINSPGGSVFDGLAIYNRLRDHSAGVDVKIDGIAASIASVIAMAGRKVSIAENGFLMIHNPSAVVGGEADDMREMADVLDKVRDAIATTYARKTGMEHDALIKLMDEECYMNAVEAMEMGFVDEVSEPMQLAAKFDKSRLTKKLAERLERGIDNQHTLTNSRITMNADPTPEPVPEVTPEPATEVTPEPAPEPEAPAAPQVSEEIANAIKEATDRAITAERSRVNEITAWAEKIGALHNIDLAAATSDFITSGKSVADFKEHVISAKFDGKPLPTPQPTNGGSIKTRAEFAALNPFAKAQFLRDGGTLKD